MNRTVSILLALLAVLLFGSIIYNEAFTDVSGTLTDASGNTVILSISDLFSLFGKKQVTDVSGAGARDTPSPAPTFDSQYVSDLRNSIVDDVKQTVRAELDSRDSQDTILNDSCIDSVANQQGADFMRYIPGKNPADYIRKDSIPCYGCSLPN
jgi:hypothetical protein